MSTISPTPNNTNPSINITDTNMTTKPAIPPNPEPPTPKPRWIFYTSSKPTPALGTRARGYCELESGHIFSTWGRALEATRLARVVIVVPIPDKKDMLVPTTRPDMVSTTRADGPPPEVGSEAEGFWEPDPEMGSSVVCYGIGTVVAVYEDVTVFLVARAGGAVHPKSGFLSVMLPV